MQPFLQTRIFSTALLRLSPVSSGSVVTLHSLFCWIWSTQELAKFEEATVRFEQKVLSFGKASIEYKHYKKKKSIKRHEVVWKTYWQCLLSPHAEIVTGREGNHATSPIQLAASSQPDSCAQCALIRRPSWSPEMRCLVASLPASARSGLSAEMMSVMLSDRC